MNSTIDAVCVAVSMRRRATTGPAARWQPDCWELAEVVPQQDIFGAAPRLLYQDEREERWLHPGHRVELFKDDVQGYLLNLTSPAPCWFVMWRLGARPLLPDAPAIALPQAVSLSYHDAGRWLDAQETVEQVAAAAPVVEWLHAFTARHHVSEPRRRQRPQSFRSLQDRFGNPASISTDKRRRGPADDGNG